MNNQIVKKFDGVYAIDEFTKVENPTVTVIGATDDLVDSVTVVCTFESTGTENVFAARQIGSFDYEDSWDNDSIIAYLDKFMEGCKVG